MPLELVASSDTFQEEAWNFLHGLEEEVPCTVETLQLYASWSGLVVFLRNKLGFCWKTWIFFSKQRNLTGSIRQIHFKSLLAKFPVPTVEVWIRCHLRLPNLHSKRFFAVARIPSPVIDIRLHDHNITTGWSQKRGPFCSENRVILMQIVSTRSGCPIPWLHPGASQILRNSQFSASELRKISWPSTVFWLRQEAPW